MGPRAGLEGRKISSPKGFDPGPSSPQSVAIPTELPGPYLHTVHTAILQKRKTKQCLSNIHQLYTSVTIPLRITAIVSLLLNASNKKTKLQEVT